MTIWSIQFVKSPPFERPQQVGFNVYVQVDDVALEAARFWKADFQGMDWMQDPPIHEIRNGPSFPLSRQVASRILTSLRSSFICIAAAGDFGYIHPTRFRLFIESGFTSSKLEWVEELPKEWLAIHEAVQALTALGDAAPGDA